MYSIGMAATLLGVCVKTLRRWHARGDIKCYRTIGGHRRFPLGELLRIINKRQDKENIQQDEIGQSCAVYCRVSSHKQAKRGDLNRQVEHVRNHALGKGLKMFKIYKDVGSGLNMNRKGLWKMIRDAKQGLFSIIFINFKDRLTRFGFKYLESYLSEFNVKISCLNALDNKTPESELVEDLVAIVHSFSGKLYRMRRAEKMINEKSMVSLALKS